jgi:hypothetical protein
MRPSQPNIQWVPAFFLGVMRPGREVSHLTLPSFVFKKEWSYTCTPPILFRTRIGKIIKFYPYLVVLRFRGKREVGLFLTLRNLEDIGRF